MMANSISGLFPSISEGIELLTGVPAGEASKRGNYPSTVFLGSSEPTQRLHGEKPGPETKQEF